MRSLCRRKQAFDASSRYPAFCNLCHTDYNRTSADVATRLPPAASPTKHRISLGVVSDCPFACRLGRNRHIEIVGETSRFSGAHLSPRNSRWTNRRANNSLAIVREMIFHKPQRRPLGLSLNSSLTSHLQRYMPSLQMRVRGHRATLVFLGKGKSMHTLRYSQITLRLILF